MLYDRTKVLGELLFNVGLALQIELGCNILGFRPVKPLPVGTGTKIGPLVLHRRKEGREAIIKLQNLVTMYNEDMDINTL